MGTKGSLNQLMNESINHRGVCRAAHGFAGSANYIGSKSVLDNKVNNLNYMVECQKSNSGVKRKVMVLGSSAGLSARSGLLKKNGL